MKFNFNKWQTKPAEIIAVQLLEEQKEINTLEGVILASKYDYVVTGVENEEYPVEEEKFLSKYEKVEGKKNTWAKKKGEVMACQLTKPFSVKLGDKGVLQGSKGDYLVTSITEYEKLHAPINKESLPNIDVWVVNKDIMPKLYVKTEL